MCIEGGHALRHLMVDDATSRTNGEYFQSVACPIPILVVTMLVCSALKRQLWEKWRFMAPEVEALLQASGTSGKQKLPVFDDLLWAHSVFW